MEKKRKKPIGNFVKNPFKYFLKKSSDQNMSSKEPTNMDSENIITVDIVENLVNKSQSQFQSVENTVFVSNQESSLQ